MHAGVPCISIYSSQSCTHHTLHAQLLADVDGDGEQELVLGGLDGSLAVFKVR